MNVSPIFDEEDAEHMRNHKYSAIDEGIAYRFCYSPLAAKLVDCIPEYVAPNTLTLLGFLHAIFPVVLGFSLEGFTLVGELPSWFMFL